MSQIKTLALTTIRTEGLQVRCETDRGYVDDLAELMADGQWPAQLPPCIVFFDSKDYWLADGHHRYQGAQEAGVELLPCVVHQGDKTAALWYALAANAEHGLRRTNEDKRRAVHLAYQLDPSLSDNAIAKRCRVSPNMANYTLRPLREKAALSQKDSQTALPGDWYADGEISESTRTPWDEPSGEPSLPTSGPEPASSTTARQLPAALEYRVDSNGRSMRVDRIGKSRKADTTPTPPAETTTPTNPPSAPLGLDELRLPIQREESAQAFATLDYFLDLDADLARVAKKIDALGKMPGAELLRSAYLKLEKNTRNGEAVERLRSHDIENARRELKHYRPFAATCPYCKSKPKETCNVCKGLPYLIESAWNRCCERVRQAALAAPTPSDN